MVSKAVYSAMLFIGLASSARTSKNERTTVADPLRIYTSEHDIVQIVVPLNGLNFKDLYTDYTNDSIDDNITIIFFVEADIKENGEKEFKGIYSLEDKTPKKLLDNGIAVTADFGKNKDVFFGATDGLYKYDALKKEAVKYGSVSETIIDLVKLNNTDAIYILSGDYALYNVTEQGTKKTKIDSVNARELVLDSANNLFFLGEDRKPYVLTNGIIKGFEDLPASSSCAKLIKAPFTIQDAVIFILDNNAYLIYSNGKIYNMDFDLKNKPTAYAMEAKIMFYLGCNKNIFKSNLLRRMFSMICDH